MASPEVKPYSVLTQHSWGWWDIYCCLAIDESAAREYILQEVGQKILAVEEGHLDEWDFALIIGQEPII